MIVHLIIYMSTFFDPLQLRSDNLTNRSFLSFILLFVFLFLFLCLLFRESLIAFFHFLRDISFKLIINYSNKYSLKIKVIKLKIKIYKHYNKECSKTFLANQRRYHSISLTKTSPMTPKQSQSCQARI